MIKMDIKGAVLAFAVRGGKSRIGLYLLLCLVSYDEGAKRIGHAKCHIVWNGIPIIFCSLTKNSIYLNIERCYLGMIKSF